MPLRVGEMMVIIRAQDFASRTLRRVGAEYGTMSRMQIANARTMDRLAGSRQELRRLNTLQRGNDLLRQTNRLEQSRVGLAQQAAMTQGAGGRFQPLTQAQRTARAELQRLDETILRTNRSWRANADEIDRLPSRYRRLAASPADLNEKLGITRGRVNALRGDLNNLSRIMPIERMHDFGNALSGVGRTAQLFGAVTTGAFALSARQAAQFNKEITAAATQARDIDAPMAQVALRTDQLTSGFNKNGREIAGVLDLMQEYPADAFQMADASYEVFSSMNLERKGVMDVAAGLGLLKDANKIAVAGNVDLEEATSAMITVLNNFDPQLQNTTEQFDTMFDIVRFGRMRLSDFNIMMNKIAPAAADAGMQLEDVGGAMAFLTQVMPSQRMVATGISRLIEALRHPDILKGLRQFGIEGKTASGALKPLDTLLGEIAERFPQLRTGQKSAAEFFREISAVGRGGGRGQIFTAEGRRALSEIMTHFDEYLQRQGQIERNTGEFGKTLEAQLKSVGVQWDIFVNRLRALVITIGTDAIPVFQQIGVHIQRFLKWWNSLNAETKEAIIRWSVLGSVFLLAGGILASVVGSIFSMVAALRLFSLGSMTAAGMLTKVLSLARALALITIITITIKLLRGGEMGLWNLLAASGAGAALGFSIGGPPGAVIGAITVPFILTLLQKDNTAQKLADQVRRDTKDKWPEMRRYGEYLAQQFESGVLDYLDALNLEAALEGKLELEGVLNREDFRKMEQRNKTLDRLERNRLNTPLHANTQKNTDATTKAGTAAQKYTDELTKLYDKMNSGNNEVKQSQEAMQNWNEQLDIATKNAKQTVMDNLRSMYSQMLSENQQAFGELFKGPWLTSETFDLAKEWGITPRIQDLIRDLHEQNAQFATWRASLDKLMKRGLPADFIDELRAMGPEAGQPILDQIIGATPAQTQKLIAEWKKKNAQIKAATKMDFTSEIQQFRRAGRDMGEAMINGFQNAGVGAWFDNWVKTTFPGIINSAVSQAVAEWKAQNRRPELPTSAKPQNNAAPGSRPTTNTNTDNSKSVTVHVNTDPHTDSSATARANQRRAAFEMANAAKDAIR